mgnify:CR=1 FL=1
MDIGQAWREMLKNHAENQWIIGTIAGSLQPVTAKNGLRNLPAKALYSWEPTSMLGVRGTRFVIEVP